VHVGHDGAGNRVTATFYVGGALVNEIYAYDGNNRLTSINRGGLTTSARSYDAADRVTQTISYSSPGVINERRDLP
jgi:YD repeat-containing protein